MVYILRYLVFSHFDTTKPFLRYAVVLVFLFWLAYPLYGLQRYLRLSLENGEASTYNIQNTRKYHELKVIEMGRKLIVEDPDAMVYSNYANVIWFAYRRPVDMLPMRAIELSFSERIDYLEEKYPGWPNGRDGYLIWFKPNQYYHIAQPRELELIAKVELIYEDKKSAIYRVSTK
jgi:hypothetical protein